jgi:hypothetical protein
MKLGKLGNYHIIKIYENIKYIYFFLYRTVQYVVGSMIPLRGSTISTVLQ